MPTLTGCSVCLKRALAIAKSFSRGSASIAIAAEFFWVSVMVVFMVACGWQKIYTVLQRTSTSDLGAHYLLPARSTSGISPVSAWMVIGPHIGFVLLDPRCNVPPRHRRSRVATVGGSRWRKPVPRELWLTALSSICNGPARILILGALLALTVALTPP